MTVFGEGDAKSLSDRLLMHWNTHATDVYVRDQAVVGMAANVRPSRLSSSAATART